MLTAIFILGVRMNISDGLEGGMTEELAAETAKQICLYAMMKQSRLVWEFMLTVIGEKYRLRDMSFGKIDLNTFFMRLQEQNDTVASWSDSTITKLNRLLPECLWKRSISTIGGQIIESSMAASCFGECHQKQWRVRRYCRHLHCFSYT